MGEEGTGQQESSDSGNEPAALELQRMAAGPIEPIVEEELESNDLLDVSGAAEQPGESNTEELQIQVEPSAQEPVAAPAEVAIADPTDEGHLSPQQRGSAATAVLPAVSAQEPVAASAEVAVADPTDEGHLLPQHWGSAATALLPAVCYVVKIHLPKLQESLHRLVGMDAISHILQMWEAKHYRKLHDLWHTQYESISVGNFALAFTTTLLAPTLAREFNTDDSYGLFTEAWLVALKRSGTSWHKEMAAAFERAATAAHAMLVPLGQVSQLRELVDWRHGKQRNLAMLEAFARLSPQPESAAAHLVRRCHSPDLAAKPLVHQLMTVSDPSPTRTAMQDERLPSGAVLNSPQAGTATTAYSDDRARGQPLEWNVDRLALVSTSSEVTSSSSRDERAIHSRLMAVPPTPPLSRRTQSSSSVAPHATTEAETNSSASSEELVPEFQLSSAAEHGPRPPPECLSDTSPELVPHGSGTSYSPADSAASGQPEAESCPSKAKPKRHLLQSVQPLQHRQRLSYMAALVLFSALGASCLSLITCSYHAPDARLVQPSLAARWLPPQRQGTCLNAAQHHVLPLRPTHSKATLKMSRPGPKSGRYVCEGRTPYMFKAVIMAASFHCVPGVRVGGSAFLHPPVAAPDATTQTHKANPHGLGRRADCSVTSTAKRSYKRAQHRAARFGYTIYKGTLHSAETLNSKYISNQDSKLQCTPTRNNCNQSRSTSSQHIQVFLWNASGLSAARIAELFQGLATANLDPDILIITESHWAQSCEYETNKHHVLGTGSGTWHGGITVFIKETLCPATAIQLHEPQPGRLLHVRIARNPQPIDVLAVYQHAMHNRNAAQSDPASKTLLQQREGIWHKIDSWLKSIPLRHFVLVAGDLNCGLFPAKTYIGRGVAYACQVPHDQVRLQQIVKDHELCALNTWKKKGAQAGTFLSSSGTCTQIDYILVRKMHATPRARLAHTRRDLPFIPITGMFHFPVIAEVSIKFDNRPARQQSNTLHCLPHVKASLAADPALATQFQELFHKCRDGHASDINAAMLQAWTTVCPAKNAVTPSPACDNTTSMIRALWHQRKQVRTSSQAVQHAYQGSAQQPLLVALFQHWKALSVHKRLAQALRKHCKIQKSRQIEHLVTDASRSRNALTGLYGILRRIAPKTSKRRMQLRNADGSLAGPTEQLNIIQGYFQQVYAADTAPARPPHTPCPVSFEVEEIESAIQSLPNKALPTAFAAAPLWRLCAHTAAQEIFLELQALLSARQVDASRWHRAQVVLIPKPGKPLSDPASLRPISLLPPHAKILAKLVSDRLKPLVQRAAHSLPQFA